MSSLSTMAASIMTIYSSLNIFVVCSAPPSSAKYCWSSSDCEGALDSTGVPRGLTCHWLYDGCTAGQCMCDPANSRQDSSGHCLSVRYGGHSCNTSDICATGMACVYGVCQCMSGTLTEDAMLCLRDGTRLLGHTCRRHLDTCFQKATHGYTSNDVECSNKGECVCAEGYKADEYSCRHWNIGEYGCTKSYHCEGGAVCSDAQCVCPTNYRIVPGIKKCIKNGAQTGLTTGASCDEINERSYCGKGLVCHRCGREHSHRCVKFVLSGAFGFAASTSSGCRHLLSILCYVLLVVLRPLVER